MKKEQTKPLSLGIVTLLLLLIFGGAWFWSANLSSLFGRQSAVRTEVAVGNIADTVGPFQIAASFQPDPPRVGKNTLSLSIRGADGAAVEGLTIDATANMPAMGAMPEMRSQGQVITEEKGRYHVEFDLPMAGSWPLSLSIRAPDGDQATMQFNFVTGLPVRRTDVAAITRLSIGGKDPAGTVILETARRQLIGVKTGSVVRKHVVIAIRAMGRVAYDETGLTDISLKYRGWLGKVFANYTGIRVKKGKPLFTIYSPELFAAQEEFLDSLRRTGAGNGRKRTLLETTRRRLRLWDLTESQITRLAEKGKSGEYIPILSPVTGTVIEKQGVAGSAVRPGMRLYRIADLSHVWVEADLYETDVPLVEVGQPVDQTLSYLPGRIFRGQVSYIYPYLDATTRTGRMRINVPNPDGALKPDMYVNVEFQIPFGEQLVVPQEAVIMAGKTNLVFLDRGDGRLQPQKITLGRKGAEEYVVLDGLQEGDRVVTSGNFLVAAESKLQAGVNKW